MFEQGKRSLCLEVLTSCKLSIQKCDTIEFFPKPRLHLHEPILILKCTIDYLFLILVQTYIGTLRYEIENDPEKNTN